MTAAALKRARKRARIATKANAAAAQARAERFRSTFEGLIDLSSSELARELNRCKVRTPFDCRWTTAAVLRIRRRLGHSTKRKKVYQPRIRIGLPLALHERMKVECGKRGVSPANLIRRLLEAEFPQSPH
jgi:hypothetical protein